MKVRFARRFQEGGGGNWWSVLGSAITANNQTDSEGNKVKLDGKQQAAMTAFNAGMDVLDQGSTLLADLVWEKQTKEKAREQRALSEEVNKSSGIRAAAMAAAANVGADTAMIGSSLANLMQAGNYIPKGTKDYSQLASSLGSGLVNSLGQLKAPKKKPNNYAGPSVNTLYLTAEEGVQAGGNPPVNVTTQTVDAAQVNSANQSSANPYPGFVITAPQSGKRGIKLIARFK